MSNASAALMGTPNTDPTAASAGSGTPPAAPLATTPPTGGAVQSAPPATSAPSVWGDLKPELKGYVEAKNIPSPEVLVESYRNLEKLMGSKDKLIKLPDNLDDPNAMNEIYEKLGVPKDKSAYKIEGEDAEFAEFAKDMFLEAKLTPKQAEAVTKRLADYVKANESKETETLEQQFKSQEQALKNEWGVAYNDHVKVAQAAVQAFGLDGAAIDKLESSLGFDGVMKFLHNVGSKLGVADKGLVLGEKQSGFGSMTPAGAESKITELMADPTFNKRYLSGDKFAVEQITQLTAMKLGMKL
jgi:hypothetical protein